MDKGPTCKIRNMYDANRFIVKPEAAVVDASYAELRTSYGPASVFVSHVWAETAEHTKQAISKMHQWMRSQTNARTSLAEGNVDGMSSFRVWFCTICNNQSRVVEELGEDVYYSPFAQVLRSSMVAQVALVSPFRALSRKWCNYEFCLSRFEGKAVLMLTMDGVVQAGHVAPKTLNELAKRVRDFDCKAATCSSHADTILIDQAVARMGGYSQLNCTLKDVFRAAIYVAHQCLQQAVDVVAEPEAPRLSTQAPRLACTSRSDGVDAPLSLVSQQQVSEMELEAGV